MKKISLGLLLVCTLTVLGACSDDTAKNSDGAKDTKTEETKKTDKKADNNLKQDFDSIQIGDILNGGEGGSTLEDIKAKFGEPSSTSETNIEGQNAKTMTWTGLKGGDMMSALSVSFSNDKAVSKSITGLEVGKHDKVTLEQFNSVPTDGSYTKDQAIQEFGEADGITTTIINGNPQDMLMWTKNVEGDMGANFNITFDNNVATGKTNFGMK